MRTLNRVIARAMAIAMFAPALTDADIQINVPGYTVSAFGTAMGNGDSLAVDTQGRVYASTAAGVQRFLPDGTGSVWSAAPGYSIAIAPDGTGYETTRDSGRSILKIAPNGSVSTLTHGSPYSEGWTWLTTHPQGDLYVNVWASAGGGQGIYKVDRSYGSFTTIVSGAPSGVADYRAMVIGQDGKLYVIGDFPPAAGQPLGALFTLNGDGHSLRKLMTLPNTGCGLTEGPRGTFYTATPASTGEVWIADTLTGTSTLLAYGVGNPCGVAYDRSRRVLYVRNQGGGSGGNLIYAFHHP